MIKNPHILIYMLLNLCNWDLWLSFKSYYVAWIKIALLAYAILNGGWYHTILNTILNGGWYHTILNGGWYP